MLTSSANENLIHRFCTFYGTLYALKEICKVYYAGGGGGEGGARGKGVSKKQNAASLPRFEDLPLLLRRLNLK